VVNSTHHFVAKLTMNNLVSRMSVKETYEVKSIDSEQCKEWFLYKHYAKRMPPPIIYSFGLFKDGVLQGVCTYSISMATMLRDSFKGYDLLELSRLVVNENMPKNTLSYFVSQTFKLLPKPIVLLSYSDTSQNHHGYIYQATNWLYTGLSAEFKDYAIKGMEHLHNQTIMDLSKGKENRVEWLKNKYGAENVYMVERPRKHRYFFFLGNKKEVKKMMGFLPYESMPYPKGDNNRYDATYKPTIQTTLF